MCAPSSFLLVLSNGVKEARCRRGGTAECWIRERVPLHVSASCRSGVSFTGLPAPSRFSRSVVERVPWGSKDDAPFLFVFNSYVRFFLVFLCEFTRLRGAADALDSWAQLCEDARRSEPLTLSPAPLRGETRRNVSLRRSVPFVPSSASAVRIWGASRFCMFCRLIQVHWPFFFSFDPLIVVSMLWVWIQLVPRV